MAKKVKVVESDINVALLQAIGNNSITHVSQEDGLPLLQYNPPLIEVNTNDIVDNKAAVRLTADGAKMIGLQVQEIVNPVVASNGYAIISNAELPASKRGSGRGGAPVQYPFDKLEVGQSFFVPISVKHPNPVKTLGSTVSSANMRFSVETGEIKQVERTKRGEKNKAVLNPDGSKVRETVTVPVRKQTRKFSIRPVKAGVKYGEWMAEADGALIARVL